jgi:hypothetical protein
VCKPGCTGHAAQCPDRTAGGLVFAQIKEKGQKNVPVPPELVVGLREHRDAQYLQRLTVGDEWEDNDLVFCQWNGRPIDPRLQPPLQPRVKITDLGRWCFGWSSLEPPIGIEPMTYSLRVNRSAD